MRGLVSQLYSDQAVASSSSPRDTSISWGFSSCQSVGCRSVAPARVRTLVTQGSGQLGLFCPVAMTTTASVWLWHMAHSTGATGINRLPGPRGAMAKPQKQRGARPFPEPSPRCFEGLAGFRQNFVWGGKLEENLTMLQHPV